MPIFRIAKVIRAKLKIISRSINLFNILTDQDKKNNPSNNIIQIQIKRRPTNLYNAEIGVSFRKPRKVNIKSGNSKNNIYIFINTLNMSPTLIIILIININILALLISAFNQRRAKSLANRPLFVLPKGSNNQKDKTLNNIILRMLYRQLEHQDKHLEYQDKHLKYQDELLKKYRDKIKDLHFIISMLLIIIKGNTTKNQELGY